MTDNKGLISIHPEGEWRKAGFDAWGMVGSLDTFAGKVHVRWAPEAAVSSHGLLPYFIEFLKVSGRFDAWVADCQRSSEIVVFWTFAGIARAGNIICAEGANHPSSIDI